MNAGDGLMVMALAPLITASRTLPASLTLDLIDQFEVSSREAIRGWSAELRWRQDLRPVGQEGYFRTVLSHACWPIANAPLATGALIARRGDITPDLFLRFGFFFSAAWKIHFDLRHAEGPVAGRRPLRPTLPLALLLERLPETERSRLFPRLDGDRAPEPTETEWALVDQYLRREGCLEEAAETGRAMVGAALHELDLAAGALPPRARWSDLAELTLAAIPS